MSNAWKGGSTRAYRKLRAAILEANQLSNGGRCTIKIPNVCTGTANVVHHTQGRAVTGDDPRYMVPACAECNLKIGEPGKHDPRPRPMTRW